MLIWQDITLWHVTRLLRTIQTPCSINLKSVHVVDAEKFNNPDVWPVGVCVRRWSVLTNKHRTMANEKLRITTYNSL